MNRPPATLKISLLSQVAKSSDDGQWPLRLDVSIPNSLFFIEQHSGVNSLFLVYGETAMISTTTKEVSGYCQELPINSQTSSSS